MGKTTQQGGKDSVLEDKKKFGEKAADEKLSHMGDKPSAAKSPGGTSRGKPAKSS
jgi:hypothetical protein